MTTKLKRALLLLGFLMCGMVITAAAQQNRTSNSRSDTPPTRPPVEVARKGTKSSASQVSHVSVDLVGPPSASYGVAADYELVVRNEGSNQVENVRVEAELPAASEFVSATPSGDVDEGTATWIIDK